MKHILTSILIYLIIVSQALSGHEKLEVEEIYINSLNFTYENTIDKLWACYKALPQFKMSWADLDQVQLYQKINGGKKSYEAYFYLSIMDKNKPFQITFNNDGQISCTHEVKTFSPTGNSLIEKGFDRKRWVVPYIGQLIGCWRDKKRTGIRDTSVVGKIHHYRYDLLEDSDILIELEFYFYNVKKLEDIDYDDPVGIATLSANKDASVNCEISR